MAEVYQFTQKTDNQSNPPERINEWGKTPAANDVVAKVGTGRAPNSTGTKVDYGSLQVVADTVTAGAERGRVRLAHTVNGALVTGLDVAEPGADQTAILIRVDRAGVKTVDRVVLGAADSGGVGFKALVVAN